MPAQVLPQPMFCSPQHRLGDSNRNLAARALRLLAELGSAMGPPIERVVRPVLAPALACLSDKKKQVRAGVCHCDDAVRTRNVP